MPRARLERPSNLISKLNFYSLVNFNGTHPQSTCSKVFATTVIPARGSYYTSGATINIVGAPPRFKSCAW